MIKKGGKFFLIFVLIAVLFIFKITDVKAAVNIVISEIQISGGSATDEFVELYNPTSVTVNLTGYRLSKKISTGAPSNLLTTFPDINLPAGGFYLVSHPTGYDGVMTVDAVYSTVQSITPNNTIILYSDAGATVVDKVGFGTAGDFEGTATVNPSDNQSIVRKIINGRMQDTDDNGVDFELRDPPDPQNFSYLAGSEDGVSSNTGAIDDNSNTDNTSGNNEISTNSSGLYNLGDVVINEFVSDPADGEEEWIEIYNNAGKIINLSGWTIEEGSGAKTILSGEIDRFFVISSPKGNLNNAGDIIILRDNDNTLIDQISYGSWDDGSKTDNAPSASDPGSTARKFDGQNTYNNLNDFSVSFSPTMGEVNIILAEEISADSRANYSDEVLVSEIFPNPDGDDSGLEFVELYNKGGQDVDLTGWKIGDESRGRFIFKTEENNIIKAGEYLVLYRERTNIALNNNGDSVKLFYPGESEPYLTIKYENVVENWSYNLNNQEWVWSEIITPGKDNEIKIINNPPVVDFSCPTTVGMGVPVNFNADDTFDADGDILQYFWDFGDGIKNNLKNPQHTFLQAGNFNVSLAVKDKEVETIKERIIKVAGDMAVDLLLSDKQGVVINEFLPNPEGSDTEGEWIELYNQGGEVNLLNWKVDDSDGGSKPYEVSSDLWFDPGDFFLLPRPESGLALNNTSDSIRLFNDQSELMDEIEYESVVEGESYARGENGKWFWTTILTPKEKNIISVVDSKNLSSVLGEKISVNKINNISLAEAQEMESGELVHVFGSVAVLPGILGSQYFYIVDDAAGIQVYNYKKEFPFLRVGDYVEISGEIAISNGEKRIKTKTKDDMIILEHRDAPTAVEIACDKIDDSYAGRLVKISGEITERKSSVVYFDDGTDEAIVYIKKSTGISLTGLKEGGGFAITGIVGKTKTGIRIMPREPEDIVGLAGGENNEGAGQVLGEVAVSDEWEIAKRDKKLELFKYLLVIAGGLIVALGIGLTKIATRSKK